MVRQMSLKAPVTIALTVDIEGDWFELPGEQGTFDVINVLEAVENLEILLTRIESRIETRIPITWFIRCDDSVAKITGKVSGLLHYLDNFIIRRTAIGDEFGIHPHLYTFSNGNWGPERDPSKQKEQIERAVFAWKSYFGSAPLISRMGEAVMNNTIANFLDEFGVEIDSSALASRKRFDNGFQFDWTNTPSSPFHPSLEDYRRPAIAGESSHHFTEIPFTMVPILGPNDKEPMKRYCNLAFKPQLIKNGMLMIGKIDRIVSVLHPHELLSSSRQHALIAHDPNALEKNIQNLREILGGLCFTLLSSYCRYVGK